MLQEDLWEIIIVYTHLQMRKPGHRNAKWLAHQWKVAKSKLYQSDLALHPGFFSLYHAACIFFSRHALVILSYELKRLLKGDVDTSPPPHTCWFIVRWLLNLMMLGARVNGQSPNLDSQQFSLASWTESGLFSLVGNGTPPGHSEVSDRGLKGVLSEKKLFLLTF